MPTPRLSVDRGGTFVDAVLSVDGRTLARKSLANEDIAPLRAIADGFGVDTSRPFELRIGTTLATNALLEGQTSDALFITHTGLEDLLEIDDQRRPEVFAFDRARSLLAPKETLGVSLRRDADGRALPGEFDPVAFERACRASRARGCRSAAIALLHGARFAEDELTLAGIAARVFDDVVRAGAMDGAMGLLARAQSALLEATLTHTLRAYSERIAAAFPTARVAFMSSSGGLVPAEAFGARDAVLSGPAGGALAVASILRDEAGASAAIGFDMGGTSTDVCRVTAEPARRFETRIGGVRVRAPMIAVDTVAAGGGSLCRFEHGRLRVGPTSAGAVPGPLCYGHADAREVALTDASLVLGRLVGDHFPFALDEGRAREGLHSLAQTAGFAGSAEAFAEGLVDLAVEQMSAAIEDVSLADGHDPRDHVLVPYGGAAGQFACRVAARLGISSLLFHPMAGVLCAHGIGGARETTHASVSLGDEAIDLGGIAGRVAPSPWEGVPGATTRLALDLGCPGKEVSLTIPVRPGDSGDQVLERFHRAHVARFGYAPRATPRMRVLRVMHSGPATDVPLAVARVESHPSAVTRMFVNGAWSEVPKSHRASLPIGASIAGPHLILDETGTIVLEPGFVAVRGVDDALRVRVVGACSGDRVEVCPDSPPAQDPSFSDPVSLSVLSHAFMAIATRMGTVLERTASSPNIRDRLDFSCAVFDAQGRLVANAPHIPVHLGAMGAAVRAMKALAPEPGDVFATNDPAHGGSHLPDITVVHPIFGSETAEAPQFFVAARGHHADVGGITPGSMPAHSTSLAQEGVVLRGLRVVRGGELDVPAIRAAFEAGPHPARDVDTNLADLEAQVAACHVGARELARLCARMGGARVVSHGMSAALDRADGCVRAWIQTVPARVHTASRTLDDGSVIQVALERLGERLRIDFAGTSEVHAGNLNAPRAIVDSCVLYVVRCLVEADIPLNEGCLRSLDIVVPSGSMLDPPEGVAVAGGNVETSQAVVDALLEALGVAAGGQGTMNNLSLGNPSFGYYETLAGGAGAGPGFEGASAAHVHMTNSSITDPEILETRTPLRVTRFAVRRGSGGEGDKRGGDGVVRELEALAPVEVSMLAERRVRAPRGLAGGCDGRLGRDQVLRRDGTVEPLGTGATLEPGDRVRVETPGGGGYGTPC